MDMPAMHISSSIPGTMLEVRSGTMRKGDDRVLPAESEDRRAPILKHFDPERSPVILVYASKWAVAAALLEIYDKFCRPVMFTKPTLKANAIYLCTVEY